MIPGILKKDVQTYNISWALEPVIKKVKIISRETITYFEWLNLSFILGIFYLKLSILILYCLKVVEIKWFTGKLIVVVLAQE